MSIFPRYLTTQKGRTIGKWNTNQDITNVNLHNCLNRCWFNNNLICPWPSSIKYNLNKIFFSKIYWCTLIGISLFWCDACNRLTYNIFICDIMYNIQDHSGIFNSKIVSLVICEGFNLTHMWAVRESFGRVPQRAD